MHFLRNNQREILCFCCFLPETLTSFLPHDLQFKNNLHKILDLTKDTVTELFYVIYHFLQILVDFEITLYSI